MNAKNKRLGRGLEALIPTMDANEEHAGESMDSVEVRRVHTNPKQPRAVFEKKALEELKQSILENGVIQPITVRKTDAGYELVSGERRLRAVLELGFERIPAYIMTVDSDEKMLELALVENVQREDLNPIELAKAYEQLQSEYRLSQEAVAQKVGKDRATVANFIRLLKLPDMIQDSIAKGEITMGHARAIMGLPGRADQIRLWKKTSAGGWSVRRVEETVRHMTEPEEKPKPVRRSAAFAETEDRMRRILGTQVKIEQAGKGGRIEIHYYSSDDLERILEMLQRIEE
jgi:ParB family transcriptional regulator, chromosome partitioning protein